MKRRRIRNQEKDTEKKKQDYNSSTVHRFAPILQYWVYKAILGYWEGGMGEISQADGTENGVLENCYNPIPDDVSSLLNRQNVST